MMKANSSINKSFIIINPSENGRICDLCGNGKFKLLHSWEVGNRWNPSSIPLCVWKCKCGLVFLDPVPHKDQLPDKGEWWSAKRSRFRRNKQFKVIWERIRDNMIGTPKERLVKYTHKIASGGRFLEVGCGTGNFLEKAGVFYDCIGLEPSHVAANITRKKGFKVIESDLENADIYPESFDIVLMDSVIEHVKSPLETLRKINFILRKNGIVIVRTPKFGGPAYNIHKSGWNGFRHGYHTYFFSGNVLGKYFQKTGFRVIDHPKRDRILDDILILWGRKISNLKI